MEVLQGGFTLKLCDGAFPLSTDTVALSDFVKLPKNARVLDLGSGCGTIGLFLCAKDETCVVTGVEIQETDHLTALDNARRNNLTARLYSICADLRCIPGSLGSFEVCVSNPPYFTGGPKSAKTPVARREDLCPLPALFQTASSALRYGGDFFLSHRPERLAEICALSVQNHMEPKRLFLLRHKTDGPVTVILLQCRKGGKPGLKIEEGALYQADGSPTPYYRKLYHV